MKVIGLIGGMSWESTQVYYQSLNRLAQKRIGGLHSAKILLWSFDFAEIEAFQTMGNWRGATLVMIEAARKLEMAGAECLVICTNTMHKMAEEVQQSIDIPLIHIADATAEAIYKTAARKPLLLETRYTMEQAFYKGRLKDQYNLTVVVPQRKDIEVVHEIIYQELCQGLIKAESKTVYLDIIVKYLSGRENVRCDSVILGCTEISLLIDQRDISVPVFDSTQIHAQAALNFALSSLT